VANPEPDGCQHRRGPWHCIREFALAHGFGEADYFLFVDEQAAGVIEAKKKGATLLMTNDQFRFDVFLSHSSRDKSVVLYIAERMRADGLRVWLDAWEIHPGDSIPAKIEEGLEHSRVLVFCMSKNAFGAEWAQLESGTFRFRDPLNRERRFIPVRLDMAPIPSSLAQFLYIEWARDDGEYSKLLEACRPPAELEIADLQTVPEQSASLSFKLPCVLPLWRYVFDQEGTRAITTNNLGFVQDWDLASQVAIRTYSACAGPVVAAALASDGHHVLTGDATGTVRMFSLQSKRRTKALRRSDDEIWSVTLSKDQELGVAGSRRGQITVWNLRTKLPQLVLEGHKATVWIVAWSPDQSLLLSGSSDRTARVWNIDNDRCIFVLEGHVAAIKAAAWSGDQQFLVTGSNDKSLRLWELKTGRCLRIFTGHRAGINDVAFSADGRFVLSAGADRTLCIWEVESGRCVRKLHGHPVSVISASWSSDQRRIISGDFSGNVKIWDVSHLTGGVASTKPVGHKLTALVDQVQYTNAKVLLVGESGAGKTGLSKALAGEKWVPSDSTVGAWATQWPLPVSAETGIEREIWLWDFGGQADQRLIHQLYMEDAALAVLVFDGQRGDVYETIGQWDRDLGKASKKAFTKVLVAGRVDAGGMRVSRSSMEAFAKERNFACFLESSAKTGFGCEELKSAIVSGIRWEDISWRSSPLLFKRLKEEIIRLKDQGRVLMRLNELRDALRLRLAGRDDQFTDEELTAVIGLLAGPGVVWELTFGNWILLQPEQINVYAQAVIQTFRSDKDERGAILKDQMLRGELSYQSPASRLAPAEEQFVLLAMYQTLIERDLCLREHTDSGDLLIFPSYYRRERPELVGHPAVLLSFQISGFLDDIYATLVVRLHHTRSFRQDKLWRYAADFTTLTGKKMGVKLTRRSEGAGALDVYFEPAIPLEEKIIFCRYIYEHLIRKGAHVNRMRHYVCGSCGTPVGNREVAMERLEGWHAGNRHFENGEPQSGPTIICARCEKRVPLWDDLERTFADERTLQRVRAMQDASSAVLDSESKERVLVGEVMSTVALAGQLCRELSVSDHGIDMEIEFKDDSGLATGKKLYLQLKSGDTSLRRRRDGAEIFDIKKQRHATYWAEQVFPVMLVIRTSNGEVRWMEIRERLREAKLSGHQMRQIVFAGTRFDAMSVRGWRAKLLNQS
jgi:small GTP-binding protein